MLKLLPQPKVQTKGDIQSFFKARGLFEGTNIPSNLKKELYQQLNLSYLLEPIAGIEDMAHGLRRNGFFLIINSPDYELRYQYLDSEITFSNGAFDIAVEKLKSGFYEFNGDEIVSFLEYCYEDEVDFSMQVLGYGTVHQIDLNLLKMAYLRDTKENY